MSSGKKLIVNDPLAWEAPESGVLNPATPGDATASVDAGAAEETAVAADLVIDDSLRIDVVGAILDRFLKIYQASDSIRVNLQDVGVVDTAGAQLLIELDVQAKKAGKQVEWVGLNENVMASLELLGLAVIEHRA